MQDTQDNIRSANSCYVSHMHSVRSKLKVEAEVEFILLSYFKARAEIENVYSLGLSRLSHSLQAKKFRKISGAQNQASGSTYNKAPDRFPMYKLIQDMAKFTEVTAAQHKNISSELAEEASRITKVLPKIRQDLIETYLSVIEEYNKEILHSYNEALRVKAAYDSTVRDLELIGSKLSELSGNINPTISAFVSFFTGQTAEERLNKYKFKWNRALVGLTKAFNEHTASIAAVNSVQKNYDEDFPKLVRGLEGEYYGNLSSIISRFLDMELSNTHEYADNTKKLLDSVKHTGNCNNTSVFIEDITPINKYRSPIYTIPHAEYPYYGPLYMTKKDPTLGRLCGEALCVSKHYDKLIKKSKRELGALNEISNLYELMPSFGDPKDSRDAIRKLAATVMFYSLKKDKADAQVAALKEVGVTPMVTTEMASSVYGDYGGTPEFLNVGIKYGVAVADYVPVDDGEVRVCKNDRILILESLDASSLRIQNLSTMESGIVPTSVAKIMSSPAIDSQALVAVDDKFQSVPLKAKAQGSIISTFTNPIYEEPALHKENASHTGNIVSYRTSLLIPPPARPRALSQTHGTMTNFEDIGAKDQTIPRRPSTIISNLSLYSQDNSNLPGITNASALHHKYLISSPSSANLELYFGNVPNSTNLVEECPDLQPVNSSYPGRVNQPVPADSGPDPDSCDDHYLDSPETCEVGLRRTEVCPDSQRSEHMDEYAHLPKSRSDNGLTATYAVALYDYVSSNERELSIQEGEIMSILEPPSVTNDGWLMVRLGNKEGYVPASYVRHEALVDECEPTL